MMFKKIKYYFLEFKSEFKMLNSGIKYVFSQKERAIYVGCIGVGNLGDEAVFEAIKNLLKTKIHIYKTTYYKPSSGRRFRKYFFKQPNYIILGGGTLIMKKANESFLRIFKNFHKQYPSAKLIVMGTGVADTVLAQQNGFPTDIASWSMILNECEFISVRGKLSRDTLGSSKFNIHKEIKILHDPALYFLRDNLKLKKKQKKIGLNFCDILGRIYGQNPYLVEKIFKELVELLLKENWTIYLYPTAATDIVYMKKILGKEIITRLNIYKNYRNLKESLLFFDNVDIFVEQRLHSIIFSANTYTPFYAIEYESKMSDFLSSIGIKNASTRTDMLNLNNIKRTIDDLYLNVHQEQKKLYSICNKARFEQLECVNEFLNK